MTKIDIVEKIYEKVSFPKKEVAKINELRRFEGKAKRVIREK